MGLKGPFPDSFTGKMPRAERPKGWLSAEEAKEKYLNGEEDRLQSDIDNFLAHVRPPVHTDGDPFGKKIKVRKKDKGRADRRACYRGRWLSIEAKAGSRKQSDDQRRNQLSVEAAGGIYIVARRLADVQQALREIDFELRVI